MRPAEKPVRFDGLSKPLPVSVARLAPPVMPKRGVHPGFDCERDGVQAIAARAAFRNRSRRRMMRLASVARESLRRTKLGRWNPVAYVP